MGLYLPSRGITFMKSVPSSTRPMHVEYILPSCMCTLLPSFFLSELIISPCGHFNNRNQASIILPLFLLQLVFVQDDVRFSREFSRNPYSNAHFLEGYGDQFPYFLYYFCNLLI